MAAKEKIKQPQHPIYENKQHNGEGLRITRTCYKYKCAFLTTTAKPKRG